MPLPDFERVIYRRNPLIEVVFQARVPRYLPIETESPSEFQKLVIKEYPIYEQRSVVQWIVASSPQEAGGVPSSEIPGRMHAFISADRVRTVIISGDGVLVTARKYERWEEFKVRLRLALEAFLTVYSLPLITRVGLRYQNVISREALGLGGRPWRELLQSHIGGELFSAALSEEDVLARQTLLTVKLQDQDLLLLRHGLVTHKENQRLAYLIDGDFYNEAQRTADLNGTLHVAERLHANSGRLFRWCITDALYAAMAPEPIEN
jgi:uncharacterized protein (TIGR04255 family)